MAGIAGRGPALARDRSWRRLDAHAVLAGSPMRLFRVSDAGARVLDAIEAGDPPPATALPLVERLLDAGAVHPLPEEPGAGPGGVPDTPATVTVAVPAYGEPAATLAAALSPLRGLPAVVVDDGSPRPLAAPREATLVRLDVNRGPAAARNAALAQVDTPFVLFLDADARLDRAALRHLLAHMDDARLACVAPRVLPPAPARGATALERYERVRSPLDMGPDPALARSGARVGYVPSAVLLCRVDALREVGGFDDGLRFGEDVDLVWRLAAGGWRCRYEPAVAATHAARDGLRAWLRQRHGYGTAAAQLARRHPGALAPVRVTRWGLAGWALAAIGHPIVGAVAAAGATLPLSRTLGGSGRPRRWKPAAGVAAEATLHAGEQCADALISVWWPAALLAALCDRRARRIVLAAALVPAAVEWYRRGPRLDPLRYAALRVLDRGAYGSGVLAGAIAAREPGPLLPHVG